jgi:hypothetical protein
MSGPSGEQAGEQANQQGDDARILGSSALMAAGTVVSRMSGTRSCPG